MFFFFVLLWHVPIWSLFENRPHNWASPRVKAGYVRLKLVVSLILVDARWKCGRQCAPHNWSVYVRNRDKC